MNEEIDLTLGDKSMGSESPDLFHYTNLEALEGILNKNTLWASDAKYLNDSSELKVMFDKLKPQMKKIILSYLENHSEDLSPEQLNVIEKESIDSFASKHSDILIESVNSSISDLCSHFVVCFALHNEDYINQEGLLSQWRGYGNDGVAIVFDFQKLKQMLNKEMEIHDYLTECILEKVIYFYRDNDLEKYFPSLINTLEKVIKFSFGSEITTDNEKEFSKLVTQLIQDIARLKHRGFQEEKEYRIIASLPNPRHLEKNNDLEVPPKSKKIHYRGGKFGSIPYIKLFKDKETSKGSRNLLPINRILIGPSINQRANEDWVKKILKENNYNIQPERSSIPFVSTV